MWRAQGLTLRGQAEEEARGGAAGGRVRGSPGGPKEIPDAVVSQKPSQKTISKWRRWSTRPYASS